MLHISFSKVISVLSAIFLAFLFDLTFFISSLRIYIYIFYFFLAFSLKDINCAEKCSSTAAG